MEFDTEDLYPPRICDMLLSEVSCMSFVTTSDATSARAAPAPAPAAPSPSCPACVPFMFLFLPFQKSSRFSHLFFRNSMFSFFPSFFHVVRFIMFLSSFSTSSTCSMFFVLSVELFVGALASHAQDVPCSFICYTPFYLFKFFFIFFIFSFFAFLFFFDLLFLFFFFFCFFSFEVL